MPNKFSTCCNCQAPNMGAFCPACGQKAGDLHISLRAFTADALSTLTSLDNRVARTLIPLLLKPGLVSEEALNGRRARYLPPMRLYLIVSFAFFVSLRMVGGAITTSEGGKVTAKGGKGIITFNVSDPEQADDQKHKNSQTPVQDVSGSTQDSPSSPQPTESGTEPASTNAAPPTVETEASSVSGSNAEEDVGAVERFFERILTAIQNNEERATEVLLNRLAWALFLLPPIAAVWLRLLFRKRERFYVPHLVVSLHVHAAVMLFLTLGNLTKFLPGPDFLGAILAFWTPLYIVLSVRRIYKMRWSSTLWRLAILWFLHSLALALALLGSLVLTGIALS